MTQIKKTRIYNTSDLKPGDVLLLIEVGQRKKHPTWPLCNFRRIQVVSNIEKLTDGTLVYNFHQADGLTSEDGSHKELLSAMSWSKPSILDSGRFGCNFKVERDHPNFSTITYRLDNIREKKFIMQRQHMISTIKFISDVDFVPYSIDEYETLPEPYRSMAIESLKYRNANFNRLSEDRKKSFQ